MSTEDKTIFDDMQDAFEANNRHNINSTRTSAVQLDANSAEISEALRSGSSQVAENKINNSSAINNANGGAGAADSNNDLDGLEQKADSNNNGIVEAGSEQQKLDNLEAEQEARDAAMREKVGNMLTVAFGAAAAGAIMPEVVQAGMTFNNLEGDVRCEECPTYKIGSMASPLIDGVAAVREQGAAPKL